MAYKNLLDTFQKENLVEDIAIIGDECMSETDNGNDEIETECDIGQLSETAGVNIERRVEIDEGAVIETCIPTPCSSSKSFDFGVVEEPHQPRSQVVFPKRKFGQKNPEYRSFQSSWFHNLLWSKWLHWESQIDKVYCIICRNVNSLNQFTSLKSKESAFITNGFNNWKDATRAFEQHRKSACHKEAIIKWNYHVKGTSVNTQLIYQLSSEQEKARICLLKLFTSVEYLARQAMPLRGHQEDSGNFHGLLQLRGNDSDELKDWLRRKKSFVSHEIQNEMLKIMSQQILRSILKEVYASTWFSISADETLDASLTEQVITI